MGQYNCKHLGTDKTIKTTFKDVLYEHGPMINACEYNNQPIGPTQYSGFFLTL
jgi:hypothetical protein